MWRFSDDFEVAGGEVLELSGPMHLADCTLSATWGGSVRARNADITFARATISGSIDADPGNLLEFSDTRLRGAPPDEESLIGVGASQGRFHACKFEDVSGPALTVDLLGAYPLERGRTDEGEPAHRAAAFLGDLLAPGPVHDSVHLAVTSCTFRNCRAEGDGAAPVQLLCADTMRAPGLVLFRDCTFEDCAGTAGLVYIQDLAAGVDDFEHWPMRIAFVACHFVNCACLESARGQQLSPRVVLRDCAFTSCRAADLFCENTDATDELMAAIVAEIAAEN